MIIIGDIGNTDTKICFLNSHHKIIKKIILPTKKISVSLLKKKFSYLINKKLLIKKSLFCSVVPNKFSLIKSFFNKRFKIKTFELKNLYLSKIMKIKVNKKQVGSDRLSNAIAVISKKKNYIILDFGTATTFDVVIGKTYIGGVIAPGLNVSLKTLSKKASLIPNIKLKKIQKVIGNNTVNAVRSGFFWGYIGLINNVIALIKQETKKSFEVIITGGFANLFAKSLGFKVFIDKEITLKGLIKTTKLFNL